MTLIEPVLLVGAAIGGITGAVWGFGSGVGWAAAGLLGGAVLGPLCLVLLLVVLALLVTWVKEGPRAALGMLRRTPPEDLR